MNILSKKDNKIARAASKMFSQVPKKGILKGAILMNRGKHYLNIGDEKQAVWEMIKNRK